MANKLNFTKRSIEALPLPPARTRYNDTVVRGLTLLVWPTGGKVFYLTRKIDGRMREIKIGSFPDLTVDQARAKATELNAMVATGQDPTKSAEQAKGEWTFAQLGEWWIAYARDKKAKKSWELDAWMIKGYFAPLATQKLSKVSRAHLRDLHAGLTKQHGAHAANRAMELARAMFNRVIKHELVAGPNPVDGVEWNKTRSRDRWLQANEVQQFFEALDAEPSVDIRDYVLLSLFTGQRQANVLAMRWDQIDLVGRLWRIPGEETKNDEPHLVPLEDPEVEILQRLRAMTGGSPWVFPTRSRSGHMVEPKAGWRRILKRARLADLRLHDLRRTLGSWMAEHDTKLEVIGKTLGHKHPASTRIYARFTLNPVRAAKKRAIGAILELRDGEPAAPGSPTERAVDSPKLDSHQSSH